VKKHDSPHVAVLFMQPTMQIIDLQFFDHYTQNRQKKL